MPNDKFLLIKAFGWGFWADMDHLVGQLLAAELTNRIPVVYWGPNSLYSESMSTNAFELYYEPVSNYTIWDIARPGFTFYPPIWNYKNLMVEDLDKIANAYRNLGGMMSSDADVVVSDVHHFARFFMFFIKKDHWTYGMTPLLICRQLIKKYLKLKPDIVMEIEEFSNAHFRDGEPILGVHVRGTDKILEVYNLSQFNKRYHAEIKKFLDKYDVRKIFLSTDTQEVLDEYKRLYGSMIISTDCGRGSGISTDIAPHVKDYADRRRKGIEILKDTYLATKCDFFVGNGYSNVSFFVNRLKDWPESHISLLYNTLEQERKVAKRRTKTEMVRRRTREIEHRLDYPELYGGV